MDHLKHLPSPIGPTFSEALRVDTRDRLLDLHFRPVFSRIRGEFFPKDPPTSTAVQVAGLLLNAKIEIDAVAFLPAGPAA
jgi:enamine deaminase RidA (YjgF/YER057c/UK114 family)